MLTNGKPYQIKMIGETIDRYNNISPNSKSVSNYNSQGGGNSVGILSPMIADLCLYPTPINLSFPVTNQIYFKNSGTSKVRWFIDRSTVMV